ncbi:MAG: SDR family NAD(P)-dependent oxidoreductase [Planctomycetota bacterium]|nr:SDR family NAD(P)-dependent oxidoreductase [Planctomycetota bacterium]
MRAAFAAGDRVLITGATSGIGREAARQLAARGCKLAITGRREDKLAEAARACGDAEVLQLPGSVTDQDVVKRHYAQVKERFGGLDTAILNAGTGDRESAQRFRAKGYVDVFEVNVFGACYWLEAVIPDMVAQGHGVIAGVSSPAAWRGLPATGAYSSSKAALATLLESARIDLRGTGVEVVTVCPGFVKSELTDRNDPKDMAFLLETDDGVRRMLKGIEKRKRIVHFPWIFTGFLRYVVRPMPGFLYDRIVGRHAKRFARKRPR